jgi:hypothetical protein
VHNASPLQDCIGNAFDTNNFREKALGLKDTQQKKCDEKRDEMKSAMNKMREEREKRVLQIKRGV